MKSKRLFVAIGNIDERFIDEDAEEIANLKNRPQKRTATFSPWLKLATPLAACLIIAVAIFAIPKLPINHVEPPAPPSSSAVSETTPAPHSAETPYQIGFYGEYRTLVELIALAEQSDQDIEHKINEIQESFVNHPNSYFINLDMSMNPDKRTDLELVLQLFQKSCFPVIKDAKPMDIELYYTFDSFYNPSRNDHWQVSLRYEINEIVYNFTVSESQSADAIRQFETNDFWDLELLKDESDIRIFLQTPDDSDWVAYNHDVPESAVVFGIDVRGLWVTVIVFGNNDVLTAFDGVSAFTFGSLILE